LQRVFLNLFEIVCEGTAEGKSILNSIESRAAILGPGPALFVMSREYECHGGSLLAFVDLAVTLSRVPMIQRPRS
jgi:hypothetical protein